MREGALRGQSVGA